ncbi:NAD(P)/FAD-dependent oxidoreductase [Ravibacter arvi]|uniref:NAD(P)/FAD-dependent oxidoreductase n=1 Tax=Ravibacter arvi TaxID=2051041 RepID=A0ABP8MCM1_9BACT
MRIIVIGGGASGFMAAITAAETFPACRVTILEKSRNVLSKVRISGGGRCNVTHKPADPGVFSKNYPRGAKFVKTLFDAFGPADTVEWFTSRGVALKTEPDGRIFPVSDTSDTVIRCLVENARRAGVDIRTSVAVDQIRPEGDHINLILQDGSVLTADRVLVATGGTPKISGFDWISEHQHPILPPVPSLFTFNTPDNYLRALSGISVPKAVIKIQNSSLKAEGPLLITHWGFSGPVVLRLSAWGAREFAEKDYLFQIRINWTGDVNFDAARNHLIALKNSSPKQQLSAHAQFGIPARLWRAMAENAGITAQLKLADTPHKAINKMAMLVTDHPFDVAGKTTFKEEFVTCGGVSLDSVDPKTMESRLLKGLYFAGEVLDVDGITGGFNFQHAWSTGYAVGRHIGLSLATP